MRAEDIVAFEITPPAAVSLHVGTWHSGPYFWEEERDFYNLELSDTYVTDHDTHDYRFVRQQGEEALEFQIVPPGGLPPGLGTQQ